jgi:hypothetical protein
MLRATSVLLFAAIALACPLPGGGEGALAHDWYPGACCSGHDCRPIAMNNVELQLAGFFVQESGELIPYDDKRIRKTPPEGGARYHRCSKGGKPEAETICLYIPNWTG